MTGVNQSYVIVFDAHIIKTTQLYHVFHPETTSADSIATCGLAFVKAVNGAGESDPSNNVSIPSLPDIGPVTASLTHQVWKYDGEIRVNVSFQVRYIVPLSQIIIFNKSTQYLSQLDIVWNIPY